MVVDLMDFIKNLQKVEFIFFQKNFISGLEPVPKSLLALRELIHSNSLHSPSPLIAFIIDNSFAEDIYSPNDHDFTPA